MPKSPIRPVKLPAQSTLDMKMAAWRARKESSGVDWREVDTVSLKGAILTTLAEKVAIQFSQAQGGSGVCVALWDGVNTTREYFGTAAELTEYLEAVIDSFEGPSEDVRQSLSGGSEESASIAAG